MFDFPNPLIEGGRFDPERDQEQPDWVDHLEEIRLGRSNGSIIEFPRGWNNPWPDLPVPDIREESWHPDQIMLSRSAPSSNSIRLLGYYMPWHLIALSFRNEQRRPAANANDLLRYNYSLPIENRFGIHILENAITQYVGRFDTSGLNSSEELDYLDCCTYLVFVYVVAHEWGHYRSEVLSFQLQRTARAVTGMEHSTLSPSYLSYFAHQKRYPLSNFEEVFAEWASLKMGVFNKHIKPLPISTRISNWPLRQEALYHQLIEAMRAPTRIRPYADIRHWVDLENLSGPGIWRRASGTMKPINRNVDSFLMMEHIHSLNRGHLIDLLVHNQMQFAPGHQFNGLIKSSPNRYPLEPDSLFYHLGKDKCLDPTSNSSRSNKFLQIENKASALHSASQTGRLYQVLASLQRDQPNITLPIPVFNQILPLDPVYIHS